MGKADKISGSVVGQIALMQSVVAQLPDRESIMNFVCQGLKDIPGVSAVDYELVGIDKEPIPLSSLEIYSHDIKIRGKKYGTIIITKDDKLSMAPYIPYIENFCVIIGIIFEEHFQRRRNEELLSTLENRVQERTKELDLEIEKKNRTEISLKESKEQLSFALIASKSGIWDWDLETNSVYFDENYYKISGYDPNEFPSTYAEWKKRVHLDDVEKAEDAISAYIKGETNEYSAEFRFRCKDDSWMWILSQGKFFTYKNTPVQNAI